MQSATPCRSVANMADGFLRFPTATFCMFCLVMASLASARSNLSAFTPDLYLSRLTQKQRTAFARHITASPWSLLWFGLRRNYVGTTRRAQHAWFDWPHRFGIHSQQLLPTTNVNRIISDGLTTHKEPHLCLRPVSIPHSFELVLFLSIG